MQVGTDAVKAGFTAYDRYKGYDQWKQEHELQEKQVQAQLQQMAIDKALDYKERGASEAFLNQFLSANGLDPSILNDWTTDLRAAGAAERKAAGAARPMPSC